MFIGLVGGQHDRALLVAVADDLEEQICAGFVDGQVTQFIYGQDGRFEVTLEFMFKPGQRSELP